MCFFWVTKTKNKSNILSFNLGMNYEWNPRINLLIDNLLFFEGKCDKQI